MLGHISSPSRHLLVGPSSNNIFYYVMIDVILIFLLMSGKSETLLMLLKYRRAIFHTSILSYLSGTRFSVAAKYINISLKKSFTVSFSILEAIFSYHKT